ncbi:hypothetical protein N0V90_008069 [Kalmusia sp. IMI 367209]|nr:hypothetical protein N0V90_008069 [Kalmusia sp. IMI 367209]
MRHHLPESISSLESADSDDASVGHFSDSLPTTPPSTAPQSSSSSVKSASHVSEVKEKRSPLKSSLKTSKSATSLAVRFSDPEPPPAMPQLELDAYPTWCKDGSPSPKRSSYLGPRASLDIPARPPARMRIHKRLSAPAPISRKESKSFIAPPLPPSPSDSRIYSLPVGRHPSSRVTSFQSVASAPAVLQSPPSPSQPPSQYNPLQHYVPCLAPNCKTHYTTFLLGLTFYSPQQPYQLIRKRGLCPFHAHQDLKLTNERVKSTWESMRQNCGRKTLGAIAAEFEVFVQQKREERTEESQRMEGWQKQRVLGSSSAPATKGKEKEKSWEEEWDWRFSPRPCTKKGCGKSWYSPFDNRLYLFYTTPRPSGFVPLSTLCPSCAKEDVEGVEERIEERRRDVGGVVGPEWEEWCAQVARDREMEVEFWEGAQERVVKEKMASSPIVSPEQSKSNNVIKEKKSRKRDICIVM